MNDEELLRRALSLAPNGAIGAHPNPMVGAVVAKSGRVIGEGWHEYFGGPHAEINALAAAGKRARGGTLYVTLEPCSTFGKTPPCTDAIIKARIARVVFGAADPNPANAGRAAIVLRAAGIKVSAGLLRAECAALNPAFNKFMRAGMPYVTVKIAESLDGKITDAAGRSRWISGPESRAKTHELRAMNDAVITGIGTVLKDNPLMTARLAKASRQPLRVVLDSKLQIPFSADIVKTVSADAPALIACADGASESKMDALGKSGCAVFMFKSSDGKVPLKPLLRELGKYGISCALVEAGAALTGAFNDAGLIDRYVLFVAPTVLGGKTALPALGGKGVLKNYGGLLGLRLKNVSIAMCGGDIMVTGER